MLRDLRFAGRLFARRPVFFVTAVLTVGLGIGLTSTVFGVVDGVLFRALPYRDPDTLVALFGAIRGEDQSQVAVAWADFADWRAASLGVAPIEAYSVAGLPARIRGADETTQVPAASVSAGFFDLLGTTPAVGRLLSPDDYKASATPAAVVSYRAWKGLLGGDPNVLGRTLERGGDVFVIVGVLPRDFAFPIAARRFAPDVIVPAAPPVAQAADRTARGWFLVGRLASGATRAEAQAGLDALALRLKPLYGGPSNRAFDGVTVRDLREHLVRTTRAPLRIVFLAALAVFAVACVNLVGLLAAHAEDRRRELAVRVSLGAGRGALLRQLLTESALLVSTGVAAGWILSATLFGALVTRLPPWLQLVGEPRLGERAALVAALLAFMTVVVAAVVPAVRGASSAPRGALAESTSSRTGHRIRHGLMAVEVALVTILLAAGSLLARSWMVLHAQDTGLDADRVVAVRAAPPGSHDAARVKAFNDRLAEAIRRVPGVTSVDFVDVPLLQRAVRGSKFVPPARVRHPAGMDTDVRITPGYFATMGIRILQGRELRTDDRGRGVVVSDELARRYWRGRSPVGELVTYGDSTREIVGVVSSARDVMLDGAPMPTLYHVWDDRDAPIATVVARTIGAPQRAIPQIRRAVREVDGRAAITMLATLDELLDRSVAERHFNTLLFGVFAVAALALGLVGIYGLVAVLVSRREREMGIRLALGATGTEVLLFVMSGTLRWVAAGLLAGLVVAWRQAGYVRPFVFGITETDPLTLGLVSAGFLLVAAAATYVPARRAARVDPVVALRAE